MASGKIVRNSEIETRRLTYGTTPGNFGSNVNRGILTNVASQIAQGSSTIHVFRTGNVVQVNASISLDNGAISADTDLFTLPAEAANITAVYGAIWDADRHLIAGKGVSMSTESGTISLRTTTATSGSIRIALTYIGV